MPPGPMPGVPAPPSRKKRRGRPTTLTDAIILAFKKHLARGAFFDMACAMEGIPLPTAKEWLFRGKKSRNEGRGDLPTEEIFAKFSSTVESAIAKYDATAVQTIAKHGKADPKQWQALAWILKSRSPARFGTSARGIVVDTEERTLEDGTVEQTTTIAMSGGQGGNAGLDPDLNDDDYAEAAAFLLRRKRLKQAAARETPGTENA